MQIHYCNVSSDIESYWTLLWKNEMPEMLTDLFQTFVFVEELICFSKDCWSVQSCRQWKVLICRIETFWLARSSKIEDWNGGREIYFRWKNFKFNLILFYSYCWIFTLEDQKILQIHSHSLSVVDKQKNYSRIGSRRFDFWLLT